MLNSSVERHVTDLVVKFKSEKYKKNYKINLSLCSNSCKRNKIYLRK